MSKRRKSRTIVRYVEATSPPPQMSAPARALATPDDAHQLTQAGDKTEAEAWREIYWRAVREGRQAVADLAAEVLAQMDVPILAEEPAA